MRDWLAAVEARTSGSAPFIEMSSGESLRFHELWTSARAIAADMTRAGVCPGDTVMLVLPNGPAFASAMLAGMMAGACVAPVNPLLTRREHSAISELAQPVLAVGETPALVTPPTVRGVGLVRSPLAAACSIEWTTAAAAAEPAWPNPIRPAPGDALLLFTSGSTGTPKGVPLTAANVAAGVSAVLSTYELTGDDCSPALLPWTHGHGLIGQFLATLAAGGTLSLDARGAPNARDEVASGRCTWITAVPPQLSLLVEALNASSAARSRLRFVRSASSPLRVELARRIENRLGCPVSEAYGMTETSHQAAANRPGLVDRRLGTVGQPTGVRIRVASQAPEQNGELEVAGAAVFRGYLGAPAETRAAFTHDGWYRTQDLGYVDADGYVTLIGRRSEMIDRGGFKVAPAEVEQVLALHPDVADCLVAGVPHAVLGQEIGALVVLRPGGSVSTVDIRRHCREQLAAYKEPGIVRIVTELPRLANGKPARSLAARVFETGSGGG
jgi:acyl-CoA synthetase (AMP-forming)/AMP-acid ligase II